VKYFSLSSVAVRPEASGVIHARLSKIGYNEHKRAYVEKMLRKIKEKQALMMHNMGNANGQVILDQETAISILQQMPLTEVDQYLQEDQQQRAAQVPAGGASSFKNMKMNAKAK